MAGKASKGARSDERGESGGLVGVGNPGSSEAVYSQEEGK